VSAGCVFCSIVSGDRPAEHVLQDQRTMAFLDIHPAGVGHTLVVPRTHAETIFDVTAEDWDALWQMSRRVALAIRDAFAPDGLHVRQANGRLGGQEIMHLHAHLIPRYAAGREPNAGGPADVAERLREAIR
jgi:histidine triad (HIT) family protein